MNLRDFVKETLCEIAEGVEQANATLKSTGACVNPCKTTRRAGEHSKLTPLLHEIEFDVAVTAEEGKETKGGIGIMVGSLGLGSQGRSEASGSTHSRVKFTIPMLLPNPELRELPTK